MGRPHVPSSMDQPLPGWSRVKGEPLKPLMPEPCSSRSKMPGTSWTMKCQRPSGHAGTHQRYKPGTAEIMWEWHTAT